MYFFGDSFDLYATPADAVAGYWDGTSLNPNSSSFVAGRFGGQAVAQSPSTAWIKTSGSNDAVHHFCVSFQQTGPISGSSWGLYLELDDGATAQCTVQFRSDGAIVLISGGHSNSPGTILATYTGAVSAANVWFGFEIEVVISNTVGSFTVRKNGNASNDFQATGLNTRPTSTNSYANKLNCGSPSVVTHVWDDFLWRSDPSSVPWVGDVRCYVRRPASDQQAQWTPSGNLVQANGLQLSTLGFSAATAFYAPLTPSGSGTLNSVTVSVNTASTSTIKCTLFTDASGGPGAVIASANTVTNPAASSSAVFTFSSPPSVTTGTRYWLGFSASATSGNAVGLQGFGYASNIGWSSPTAYAAFPVASPTPLTASQGYYLTANISTANNFPFTADVVQDGATTYVSSSTSGQSDFYGLPALPAAAQTIVGMTTRAFAQKSDAGTRNVATQIKSGGTTSQGASTALNTTWSWVAQTNLTDPATGAAWTVAAANAVQPGQVVTA